MTDKSQPDDLRFNFPTDCKSFPVNGVRRTEITLGEIRLIFHGPTVYQVLNVKTKEGYYWADLPGIRLGHTGGLYKVSYSEMLFNMNRMLMEQAMGRIGPIMDRTLGGRE